MQISLSLNCSPVLPAAATLSQVCDTQDMRSSHWEFGTEPQISLTLFPYERQGPCEDIHEVWKPVGVRGTVELPDVHDVVFVFQYSSWGRKGKENKCPQNPGMGWI